jgi:hypothetical protein
MEKGCYVRFIVDRSSGHGDSEIYRCSRPTRNAVMANQMNDNEGFKPVPRLAEPDPYGQSALLLVESLIHGLVARSILTLDEAVDVLTVALDVKDEIAADLGDSQYTKDKSMELLAAIRASLSNDLTS